MTREDLLAMCAEAGFNPPPVYMLHKLERLVNATVERYAKACGAIQIHHERKEEECVDDVEEAFRSGAACGAEDCACAIRDLAIPSPSP